MTETNGLIIVERIDTLLKEKKENRRIMCVNLGITPSVVSSWAIRGTVPQADILYRISKYLNCSSEYLMYGIGEIEEDFPYFTDAEKQMIYDFRTFSEIEKKMIIALFQQAKEEQKKTSEKALS